MLLAVNVVVVITTKLNEYLENTDAENQLNIQENILLWFTAIFGFNLNLVKCLEIDDTKKCRMLTLLTCSKLRIVLYKNQI